MVGSIGGGAVLPNDRRLLDGCVGEVGIAFVSSDSGTILKLVGVLREGWLSSVADTRCAVFGLLRTAAAQDSRVVRDARRAASWSCRPLIRSMPSGLAVGRFKGNDLGNDDRLSSGRWPESRLALGPLEGNLDS